jgi:hypothetical protein
MPASGLVLVFGIAALVFGTLITSFSGPSGRTPGIVIICIGTLLTVPGLVAFRRARRGVFFSVTKRWSWGTLLGFVGTLTVVVGGSLLIAIVLDKTVGIRIPAALLFVPGIGIALKWYLNLRNALLVNALGVRLDGVPAPWSTVDQLHVASADDADGTEVSVQLRQDTASDQKAPRAVVQTRKLDVAGLRDAVRRFGPPEVRVVVHSSTQRASG